MRQGLVAACGLGLAALSGLAPARGATVYDSLAGFFAAVGPHHLEDFESSPLVGSPEGGAVSQLPFDGVRFRADPASLKLVDVPYAGLHGTSTFGPNYLAADTGSLMFTPHLTLEFEPPIYRLGFFIMDLESFDMEVTIGGAVYTIPPTNDGGMAFFGIISETPFGQVEFLSTGGERAFALDDLRFTIPPFPSSSGDIGPTQPLDLQRLPGGDLQLSWSASCSLEDFDYEIYEGTLGDFSGHQARACSTAHTTSATITPAPGDTYYLVVPRNVTREGSYGRDSDGAERFRPITACLLPATIACP